MPSICNEVLMAAMALAGIATATATLRVFLLGEGNSVPCVGKKHRIRRKLPRGLETWRLLEAVTESIPVWEAVRPVLFEAGIVLWTSDGISSYAPSGQTPLSNGFAYVPPVRAEMSWSKNLHEFNCQNELTRGGTTLGGLDVVIRVAAIGNEGKQHLEILHRIARGTKSLLTENHVVPLWGEAHLEDVVFIISPYVGYPMDECYGFWANNSVGDIVDMILQALEAIVFVHDLGIVHRDLCKSNFLVQWHPESLRTMQVPLTRPRVFLTDFEMAHEFPPETPKEQHLLKGLPREGYRRPIPPEMASGTPYDPFKADVWQFAESLSDFKTTIPEIDAILGNMLHHDCGTRLSAVQARDELASVVSGLAPATLLISPLLCNPWLT